MDDVSVSTADLPSAPTAHLLALPTELQQEILSYVRSPRDLNSLCLTHRDLHALAIGPLYETICLPVSALDGRLNNSLNLGNRGLSHTRKLHVTEPGPEVYEHSVHGQNLRDLLLSLPSDRLEHLNIDTTGAVSTEITGITLGTQRNLHMHQVHVGKWPRDMPPVLLTDKFSGLVSLSVHLEDEKTIAGHSSILHQLPNLKDLAIKILSSYLKSDCYKVVPAMFHHPTAPKLKLVRLYLEFFDFWLSETSDLVDSLDLAYLKDLALLRSQGTWRIMERLSQWNHNLESFINDRYEDWQAEDWQAVDEATASDDFLYSFRGLRTLKKTFLPNDGSYPENDPGVGWSAVQQHSNTLQVLHLNDALRDEDAWTSAPDLRRSLYAFCTLCSSFRCLEQLTIKPPSVELEVLTARNGFMEFLDCLKSVKTLKSLKLMLPPLNPGGSMDSDVAASLRRIAETKMRQLADTVFSELHPHCPQFTSLVLSTENNHILVDHVSFKGITDGAYLRQNDVAFDVRSDSVDWGYLRRIDFDPNGQKILIAQPMKANELQYHEPASDIFHEHTNDTWFMKHAMKQEVS